MEPAGSERNEKKKTATGQRTAAGRQILSVVFIIIHVPPFIARGPHHIMLVLYLFLNMQTIKWDYFILETRTVNFFILLL